MSVNIFVVILAALFHFVVLIIIHIEVIIFFNFMFIFFLSENEEKNVFAHYLQKHFTENYIFVFC